MAPILGMTTLCVAASVGPGDSGRGSAEKSFRLAGTDGSTLAEGEFSVTEGENARVQKLTIRAPEGRVWIVSWKDVDPDDPAGGGVLRIEDQVSGWWAQERFGLVVLDGSGPESVEDYLDGRRAGRLHDVLTFELSSGFEVSWTESGDLGAESDRLKEPLETILEALPIEIGSVPEETRIVVGWAKGFLDAYGDRGLVSGFGPFFVLVEAVVSRSKVDSGSGSTGDGGSAPDAPEHGVPPAADGLREP